MIAIVNMFYYIVETICLTDSVCFMAFLPKPVCVENIEVMWYVDEKGGTNAVKYEKNRTSQEEKENKSGKKKKENYVKNVYAGFRHSCKQE
jgi:hypothetical protein